MSKKEKQDADEALKLRLASASDGEVGEYESVENPAVRHFEIPN